MRDLSVGGAAMSVCPSISTDDDGSVSLASHGCFRRFAHGKPAVLLVAERLTAGSQLSRFADVIATMTQGVAPDLPDVPTLFRTLFRLSRDVRRLAVIDEFPWLLGRTRSEMEWTLSGIQAAMEEERDASKLKLILCGSAVNQMEALQGVGSPLHGRMVPLELRPLSHQRATIFLPDLEPIERFERFAIAGGMPRYLEALQQSSLQEAVSEQILQPDAHYGTKVG